MPIDLGSSDATADFRYQRDQGASDADLIELARRKGIQWANGLQTVIKLRMPDEDEQLALITLNQAEIIAPWPIELRTAFSDGSVSMRGPAMI